MELIDPSMPENLTDYETLDYSEGLSIDRTFAIIVPVLLGLIFMIGFFGNALVVIVVACNQQMRNTTNLLIINLALADLLFIVFCVPFTATDYAMPYWPFGNIWCKIVQYLIIVCVYASVYTLMLMSLDRFLAIVYPITSMAIRTERNTYFAIGIMWVVIFMTCIPVLLAHGQIVIYYNDQDHAICTVQTEEYNYLAFQIIFFLTSYAFPLAVICGLNLFMLKRVWYRVVPGDHVSAESLPGKKRVTRMVIIVVVVFAVCWGPIQVILLLKTLEKYDLTTFNVSVQIMSQVLAYMNSCVNPILYAFISENFRKAFRKVLSCGSTRSSAHNRLNSKRSETLTLTKSISCHNNDSDVTNTAIL